MFWGCFRFLFESLILSELKQTILDEIKQSNGMKPPKKSTFLILFVSVHKVLTGAAKGVVKKI